MVRATDRIKNNITVTFHKISLIILNFHNDQRIKLQKIPRWRCLTFSFNSISINILYLKISQGITEISHKSIHKYRNWGVSYYLLWWPTYKWTLHTYIKSVVLTSDFYQNIHISQGANTKQRMAYFDLRCRNYDRYYLVGYKLWVKINNYDILMQCKLPIMYASSLTPFVPSNEYGIQNLTQFLLVSKP